MVFLAGLGGAARLCTILLGMVARHQEYFDTTNGIQERFHSRNRAGLNKIAIIEISGIITDGEGFAKNQISRVRDDDQVKAVVLRINSPGGTVTGSDFIYHHLLKLKQEKEIPLVVSMGSLAASGGYYVAMAVGDQPDTIFAEPTTTTGSIGVIIPHYDLTGLMERFDIRDDSIVSHPHKQLLSMTHPTTEEEREILKRYVMQTFDRFKRIVLAGRPRFRDHPEQLAELATGEIFTAEAAAENGLVDKIGFIEDAIDRAAELAELVPSQVRVVRYKAPLSLWEAIGAVRAPDQNAWLSLTIPRAYYLFTSLPSLVRP